MVEDQGRVTAEAILVERALFLFFAIFENTVWARAGRRNFGGNERSSVLCLGG
jgi:hypothetical protein